jgi:hypothetical protein
MSKVIYQMPAFLPVHTYRLWHHQNGTVPGRGTLSYNPVLATE